MAAAWALSIPAGVAATLLACVVCGRRRVPAAGAAAIWLCAAAVLLAGCGSPAQAKPGASGTGGSRVTPVRGGRSPAAGDQGTITRTANGTAFVADGRPTTRDLYGITCVDAVTCYAVGNGGTIVSRR